MTPLSATAEQPEAPLFSDGLGDRVVAVDAATGDLLQILRVRPQLLSVPSFEFALRERAARLANFRHAYYARVRRIDRHPSGLAIVSDHVEGVRLSDLLRLAHERNLQLDLNAALCLLRQLVPSMALLHENARDVAHGLIGPERLIVTPRARLVVVEHVLGSAVEQLQFNRERLWQELRVSLPPAVGLGRSDQRAGVPAIGLVALALVLGRRVGGDEYPHHVGNLLANARAKSAGGLDQPLPTGLHQWIARALQLDPRHGFTSATDAQVALEDALSEDSDFVAAPVALETFLSRYIAAMLEPMPAAPVVAPPPPAIIPARAPIASAPIAAPPSAPIVPPVAPIPVASPVAAIPVASIPLAPAPVAPAPVAPIPVAAIPVSPVPVASTPVSPVPVAPAPRVVTPVDPPFSFAAAPSRPLVSVTPPEPVSPPAPVARAPFAMPPSHTPSAPAPVEPAPFTSASFAAE